MRVESGSRASHAEARCTFSPDVQAALDRGELWRAKQILGGRIGASRHYDTALYEDYGRVLLRMNDLVLAGKYLFLAGVRTAETEEAVQLYLRQHGRGGWKSLSGTFPNAAKRLALDEFPERVRQELAALGVTESPVERELKPRSTVGALGWRGTLVLTGCALASLFVFAALMAGIPIVFRALVSLFQ